jgi:hypothetical protein
MIKLSEYHTQLINLPLAIKAIEEIDRLTSFYSVDKPGPAYCKFEYVDGIGECSVQFDRYVILVALKNQRQIIVDYLATLGVEA